MLTDFISSFSFMYLVVTFVCLLLTLKPVTALDIQLCICIAYDMKGLHLNVHASIAMQVYYFAITIVILHFSNG